MPWLSFTRLAMRDRIYPANGLWSIPSTTIRPSGESIRNSALAEPEHYPSTEELGSDRVSLKDSNLNDFLPQVYASNKPAAPCPPPMHIVTTPYFALRLVISLANVPTILDPVIPNGWPIEIEPPFTLSFSGSIPRRSRQ